MQPFKGVKNYFTDSLLYQENSKIVKKLLPEDIDNDNEADSESGDDPTTTFDVEPIVAYFDNLDCNNSAEADDEWVLNENVNFDYSLCLDDVNSLVDMSRLRMSLSMLKAYMQVKDNDESVFVVPSLKEDQLPIIFGRD